MMNWFLQGDSLVADTSSLIYLAKSSIIRPFVQVFRVAVPPIVYEECIHQGYPGSDEIRTLRKEGGLSVHPVMNDDWVGRDLPGGGEREVIQLFYQLRPDGVLIDDGDGVKACRNRGIPFVSALLIPSLLLVRDVIGPREAEESLEIIVRVGRYSEHVVLFARRALSDAHRRDRPRAH
jgi:predicted nucleic acid-binding protein